MKKLFFVMVLWFAPAPAFAYDLAAENARHQKAWDELFAKTDEMLNVEKINAILGAKAKRHPRPYLITENMTMYDRQIRRMIEATWWGAHVAKAPKVGDRPPELINNLHNLFSHYARNVAEEDTNWLRSMQQYAIAQANRKRRAAAAAAAATDRQLDRMEREIANERMIDAMEDNAAATRELKNEVIMNQMMSDRPSPTVFCRTLAGTTICN